MRVLTVQKHIFLFVAKIHFTTHLLNFDLVFQLNMLSDANNDLNGINNLMIVQFALGAKCFI